MGLAGAAAIPPPDRWARLEEELKRVVIEPDAKEWLIQSIRQSSANALYWGLWLRRWAMGDQAFLGSRDSSILEAEIYALWRFFRLPAGGFSQLREETWPSIFGSVYAIRALRLYVSPARKVTTRNLLGENVVEMCLRFVLDLWRDGSFANGRPAGIDQQPSLTKLYYAVALLHLLGEDALSETQWQSAMSYLRGCMVEGPHGIGFEYQEGHDHGGWACTTYYAIRLLDYYREVRGLGEVAFSDALERGLGVSLSGLRSGVRRFLTACWQPGRGCTLSPGQNGEATLNHTYMFVQGLRSRWMASEGGPTVEVVDAAELASILERHRGHLGGYALTPGGEENLASTYVGYRLALDFVPTEVSVERRQEILSFVDRCRIPGEATIDFLLAPSTD